MKLGVSPRNGWEHVCSMFRQIRICFFGLASAVAPKYNNNNNKATSERSSLSFRSRSQASPVEGLPALLFTSRNSQNGQARGQNLKQAMCAVLCCSLLCCSVRLFTCALIHKKIYWDLYSAINNGNGKRRVAMLSL